MNYKEKRYLITGVSGFVGGHYLEYLSETKPEVTIIGVDVVCPQFNFLKSTFSKKIDFYKSPLLDRDELKILLEQSKPDYIVHLASQSSVALSWCNPVESFTNNTNIFLNIIEAVRLTRIKPKILSVGSSEEYGIVNERDLPLREDARLNPNSPYAVARVAQEMLSLVYAKSYGVPIICSRSFNHIGPRQRESFVISSFTKQIVEARAGTRDSIECGDITIIRDFIDVRDVVRAYDLLLEKGMAGEIYNVCSGEGHALSEILNILQKKAAIKVPIKTDSSKIRPVDNPIIIGSNAKLNKATCFEKTYTLSDSLDDMLRYWEVNV